MYNSKDRFESACALLRTGGSVYNSNDRWKSERAIPRLWFG